MKNGATTLSHALMKVHGRRPQYIQCNSRKKIKICMYLTVFVVLVIEEAEILVLAELIKVLANVEDILHKVL